MRQTILLLCLLILSLNCYTSAQPQLQNEKVLQDESMHEEPLTASVDDQYWLADDQFRPDAEESYLSDLNE